MNLVQWQCIPGDVILTIVLELVKPLRNKEKDEKNISDKYTNVPTPFEKTVYTYFSLLTHCK